MAVVGSPVLNKEMLAKFCYSKFDFGNYEKVLISYLKKSKIKIKAKIKI